MGVYGRPGRSAIHAVDEGAVMIKAERTATNARIEYLADHMQHAPQLAAWHHQEWGGLLPNLTLDEALAGLQCHTSRCLIPTTLIALEANRLIGSTSLLQSDLEGWEHLWPWVASVYVVPDRRGNGVGRQLITRAVDEARRLGVAQVYLFTATKEQYYAKLGWSRLAGTTLRECPIVIMQR